MRTVRCSGRLLGGGRGVCPNGCLARGVFARGCVCPGRGLCLGGVHLPPCGQTDTCENNLSATTVAGSKKEQLCETENEEK